MLLVLHIPPLHPSVVYPPEVQQASPQPLAAITEIRIILIRKVHGRNLQEIQETYGRYAGRIQRHQPTVLVYHQFRK